MRQSAAQENTTASPIWVKAEGWTDYETVDTRSENGLKKAERLQKQGWQIGSVGLYTIQFFRYNKVKV